MNVFSGPAIALTAMMPPAPTNTLFNSESALTAASGASESSADRAVATAACFVFTNEFAPLVLSLADLITKARAGRFPERRDKRTVRHDSHSSLPRRGFPKHR